MLLIVQSLFELTGARCAVVDLKLKHAQSEADAEIETFNTHYIVIITPAHIRRRTLHKLQANISRSSSRRQQKPG